MSTKAQSGENGVGVELNCQKNVLLLAPHIRTSKKGMVALRGNMESLVLLARNMAPLWKHNVRELFLLLRSVPGGGSLSTLTVVDTRPPGCPGKTPTRPH